ncbi:chondroitinase-B domain-containing protein [Paenibacillus silviterrae]|uniref:chondroitinase-B domain-containing protein n=1 Tax=Paenibacillus silviterrae TaxID=3242194 RepID=UPI00254273C4|nr:chondroitinase-B domain-containing protein [Paenibacillus chinjuensis]
MNRYTRLVRILLAAALVLAGFPLPFAAPAHAESVVLLQDDFNSYPSSPVGSVWSNGTGNGVWDLETRESPMLRQNATGTTYVVSRGDMNWADYAVSAKVMLTGTPTTGTARVGIAARYVDKNNYYTLLIRRSTTKDDVLLTKRINNSESTLSTVAVSSTIDESKVYELRLALNGSELKGYVNGELVIQATDAALTRGAIGLYNNSGSGYAGNTALYDDVLVTREGSGDPGPEDPGTGPQDPGDRTITVTNNSQLQAAINDLRPGDLLQLANGSYTFPSISNKQGTEDRPIRIQALQQGMAVITGGTLYISGSSYLTLEGFLFENKGSYAARLTNNRHVRLTNNVFHNPPHTGSSTWVQIDGANSSHNRIDHNVFENKLDTGKFIVVGGDNPGFTGISQYDRIDHNTFRNTLPRQTNESEPIRIGESKLSLYDSFTTVEHNLFERTDSDPEIISVKSGRNIIRYNTFKESLGTLSLRHGNGTLVYGNRFLGNDREGLDQNGSPTGTGGIRVYGDDHKIFNNYFEGLTGTKWDAPITITNGDADYGSTTDLSKHFRPRNIVIAHNTLVNNRYHLELGFTNNNNYTRPPQNITFANNIVVGDRNTLVDYKSTGSALTEGFTWQGNIMYPKGSAELGIIATDSQIRTIDPLLVLWDGEFRPGANSPVLNAAAGSYPFVYTEDSGRSSALHVGAHEIPAPVNGSSDNEEQPPVETAVKYDIAEVSASSHDGNFPENVLDDSLTTRWSAQSTIIDGQRLGEWIQFDLGSIKTVSYIGAAFHSGNARRTIFDIEVSQNGSAWEKVFSGESGGTTLNLEPFDFADRQARYVRIVGYGNTANAWNSLTVVHIYGPSSSGNPVLLPLSPPPPEVREDVPPYTVAGMFKANGEPYPLHVPSRVTGTTINVTVYGAVPNDGLDDVPAIHAAIQAAQPGDEVYFPTGVYDLIGTLPNDGTSHIGLKNGVHLRGESQAGTVLRSHFDRSASNSKMISGYAKHDILISDLTLTSTFSGTYSTNHQVNNPERGGPEYGIVLEDGLGQPSYNVTIDRVTVEKFQKMGVRISKSRDIVVRNARFQNMTDVGGGGAGYGVSIQGIPKTDRLGYANDTRHNVVENSTFVGPYMRHGIIIQYYAHNNEIRNNVFTDSRLDAIDLHGEDEYLNKIHGNQISGVLTGAGIALGNTGGTAPSNHDASGPFNHIVNNTISNSREGIKVHMGSPDTLIESNTISGTIEPANSRGILIQNGPRTVIRGNAITGNPATGFWGIVLEQDPGDPGAGGVGAGIPTDVRIENNVITSNTNGVLLSAGTGVTMTGNTIAGNTGVNLQDNTLPGGEEPREAETVAATHDAKIDIERPDTNYGVEDPDKTASNAADRNWFKFFNVKRSEDGTKGRIAYFKFPVTNAHQAEQTSFEVHARTGSNTTAVTLHVFGITNDAWTESELTWNNAPNREEQLVNVAGVGETAFLLGSFTIDSADIKKYSVDVSDFIRAQRDGWATLMIADTIGQNGNVNIYSKEEANSGRHPVLQIVRSAGGGQPQVPALRIVQFQAVDLNGLPVTTLNGGSFLRLSATLENVAAGGSENAVFVAALYRPDHSVSRIGFAEQAVAAGQSVGLGAGFDLPEEVTGHYVKLFVWNSFTGMQPLAEPIRFPN